MSQRLSRWGRFMAYLLPVLINRFPAVGLGGWCRIHSTACTVASGLALILHHWTLLCFATGFIWVWFEWCSRLAYPCPQHPASSLWWGVIVTKWWCWLSPERLGPSRWSTQGASLLISTSSIKQPCPQVGAHETCCLDLEKRKKKR